MFARMYEEQEESQIRDGVQVGKWSVDPIFYTVQPFERICFERCDGRCCSIGGVETSHNHINELQKHHSDFALPPERLRQIQADYDARKIKTGWAEIPYNPETDQCLYFDNGCTIWRLRQQLAPIYCLIFPLMVFNNYITLHPSAFTYCLKENPATTATFYSLFEREFSRILEQ